MFQQMFNNQPVWVLSNLEFIGFIISIAVLALALVLFIGITRNVSIPYLSAWLSKSKYLVIYLDKTHRLALKAAKIKAGVVLPHGMKCSAFVKKDNNGSYTLGALKVDIITGDSSLVYDENYAHVMAVLKELGVTSEIEAAALMTAYLNPDVEFDNRIIDRLARLPTKDDIDIIIPHMAKMSLVEFGRWINLTPEDIYSWCEGEKEEERRKNRRKDKATGGGMSPGLLITLIGGAALLIILMMAMGTMGGA